MTCEIKNTYSPPCLPPSTPDIKNKEPAPLHYRDKGDPTYGLDEGKKHKAQGARHRTRHPAPKPNFPSTEDTTTHRRANVLSLPRTRSQTSTATEDAATHRRANVLSLPRKRSQTSTATEDTTTQPARQLSLSPAHKKSNFSRNGRHSITPARQLSLSLCTARSNLTPRSETYRQALCQTTATTYALERAQT